MQTVKGMPEQVGDHMVVQIDRTYIAYWSTCLRYTLEGSEDDSPGSCYGACRYSTLYSPTRPSRR